jgi:hypothetical protein
MTTFRFSVIAITLVVVLLVVWFIVRGTEDRAQAAAVRIARSCHLNVHAVRDATDRRFGLAIGSVHRACPAKGDETKVVCARSEIAKSGFPEVNEIYTGSCPERGIYE